MGPRGTWIAEHRLVSFFALAFAVSWSLEGVALASGAAPPWLRWFLGGFLPALGPAAAAAVVLAAAGDLRGWARSLARWRVRPRWYLAAVGVPAAVALVAAALVQLAGGPVGFARFDPDPGRLVLGVVLATLVGGGLAEIGWRGFAQPELQERLDPTAAALAVGAAWAVWSLPAFLDPAAVQSAWPLPSRLAFVVGLLGLSVLLAWVFNGSGGSVLPAMLLRGSADALDVLAPVQFERIAVGGAVDWSALASLHLARAGVTVAAAVAVVAVVGRRLYADRVGPVGTAGDGNEGSDDDGDVAGRPPDGRSEERGAEGDAG